MPAVPVSAAEFEGLMAALGPFGPRPRIAAGVSGGPHSLALALLARDWVAARGGAFLALVADHGLRAGSGAEARAVVGLLRGAGMHAYLLPLGLPPGPRLHERARQARHAALLRAAGEAGAPWLLLGHHRGDQAETVAIRASRDSGPDGLAGMAAARPATAALVLRPLLPLPQARLEATVAAAGLVPIRDPSNGDPRFDRARWRAELADPDGTGAVTAALARTAGAFARLREVRAESFATRIARSAQVRPGGWLRLDRQALGQDSAAVAALAALVRVVGGSVHPPSPRARHGAPCPG
ncbi:tRNA lysidine(34) synthetase TilS [Roseomonas sp. CCTCC AB2023176]|uniref:tRNA lysidine(34) synthetase TilS n=1 Tax=Roseomonas sp. CCTCC AB2023176 TaxID=3342640 RepID=UPI0035D8CA8B